MMSDNNFPASQDEAFAVHVHALYLERMLDDALAAVPEWTVSDEGGTAALLGPAERIAVRVARCDELLDRHLREHRAVLADELRWRTYYSEIDRTGTHSGQPTPAAPPLAAAARRTRLTSLPQIRA